MDEPSSPEANAITLRIKFKSASLEEFVSRYGADVSAGGIFIRTKQPLAVGSILHFDFTLADGAPLVAGMGTVVWVREPDASRAGSVPGMGLRFDQLTPEGQQIHQQILGAKARHGDRAMVTPPLIPTSAPFARPPARPATPPPVPTRPMAPAPVAAQPQATESSNPFDEFDSGGKTEIAAHPPSFYFESLGMGSTAPAGGQGAEEAAPAAPLENTETDSQPVAAADQSWSEPVDIGDMSGAISPPASQTAEAAAAEQFRVGGMQDDLAAETLDLPVGTSDQRPRFADLPPPLAQRPESAADQASAGADSVETSADQNWLNQPMNETSGAGATPEEAVPERTEEVASPPQAALDETLASGEADGPAQQEAEAQTFEQELPDRAAKKAGGQGKKLIVVGVVAAGLAFAGVYLLQAKPWQAPAAPVARPAPAAPQPIPTAPPVAPKLAQPVQPAAEPAPPPAGKAAEPAKPAEPVKPAAAVAAPIPEEAPAKTNQPEAEAAKPDTAGENAKPAGHAAGSAKRQASKSALFAPAVSPAAAGQSEIVYLLKIRSVPPGAQVLIDNEPMGQTPFQRRILDADKPHVVTVRRPGYTSYEHTIVPADPWVVDGNTKTMSLLGRLVRAKAQPAASPAAPANDTASVPDQPDKL